MRLKARLDHFVLQSGYRDRATDANRLVNFDLLKDLGSPAQHRGALDSLVADRSDPRSGLFIPDLIHPIHDLDPLHGAPAGHEGARERCIRETDRKGIIYNASCAR